MMDHQVDRVRLENMVKSDHMVKKDTEYVNFKQLLMQYSNTYIIYVLTLIQGEQGEPGWRGAPGMPGKMRQNYHFAFYK